MQIVPATIMDLNALRHLENEIFEKDAWPLLDLIAVLTLPGIVRLKAVEEGNMAGFAAGDPRPSEGWGWIATIGVNPRFRRMGFARKLLNACEEALAVPRARLTVRQSNQAAITLYKSEGYETIDLLSGYYNDGENGLLMEKALH